MLGFELGSSVGTVSALTVLFIPLTLVFCLHECLNEGVESPRPRVIGSRDLPYECWKLNPDPLEVQSVLSTAETSLQPLLLIQGLLEEPETYHFSEAGQ